MIYIISMVTNISFRPKNDLQFHSDGALVCKFFGLFPIALSYSDLSYFLFLIFSI